MYGLTNPTPYPQYYPYCVMYVNENLDKIEAQLKVSYLVEANKLIERIK
jgi:hypothetical protein